MKTTILVLSLSLLVCLASSACRNPEEVDGSCSDCGDVEVLVDGYCYAKLRGCLVHGFGPICRSCQNGYLLVDTVCKRKAEVQGEEDPSMIPGVVPDRAPTLTREQIIDQIAKEYGSGASKAHNYLLDNFPDELRNAEIKMVQNITSSRNSIVRIYYQNNGDNYEALNLIEYDGSVTPISFKKLTTDDVSFDLENIQQNIEAELGDKIKDANLYDIIYNNELIVFIYINADKNVFRVKVTKDQMISTQELSLILLAFQKAIKQHTFLQTYEVTGSQDKSDEFSSLFVFQFGNILSISIEFDGREFIVNNPIRIQSSLYPDNSGDSDRVLVGGFSPFFDFQDSRFIAAKEFAEKQFPQLKNASIQKVQSQVVSGMNFIIQYELEDGSIFIIKIYRSLRGTSQLLGAEKDGQAIFTLNHNYNADDEFLSAFSTFKKQSKVIPIPPIVTVERRIDGDLVKYKVLFPDEIYATFNYNKKTMETTIISYVVDGQNILQLRQALGQSAQQRSQQVLVNFLKTQQPKIVQRQKVREVKRNGNIYTVILVTPSGVIQAEIEDRGDLFLQNFEKIEDSTCYTLTQEEIKNTPTLKSLDQGIRGQYGVNSTEKLELVQINIAFTTTEYRFLYVSQNARNIVFFLEEFLGKVNVKSAFLLNFGYGVLKEEDPDYKIAAEEAQKLNLNAKLVFAEGNGTYIRFYLKDEEKTYEVVVNKEDRSNDVKIIQVRDYLIIPNGFQFSKLLSNEELEGDTFKKIDEKVKQDFSEVIGSAKVVLAQKETDAGTTFYKVFYEVDGTFYRAQASITDGEIAIKAVFVTSYSASDFTPCKQLSDDGTKCEDCKEDEIEYQAKCFKKVEGCMMQLGDMCIKCEISYTMEESKCVRECSAYFA